MYKTTYKHYLKSNDKKRYLHDYNLACNRNLHIRLSDNLTVEINVNVIGWSHQKEFTFIRFYDNNDKRIGTLELPYFINTKNTLKRFYHKNYVRCELPY